MKRTIILRLLLIYLSVAAISGLLSVLVGNRLALNQLVSIRSEMLKRNLMEARDMVEELGKDQAVPDEVFLSWLTVIAEGNRADVRLINEDGIVVMCTAEPDSTHALQYLDGFDYADYDTVGDFYGLYDEDYLSVIIPVSYGTDIHGYLSASQPMEQLYQARNRMLSRIWCVMLSILAVLLAAFFFFVDSVYRPLGRILDGVQKFTEGNLNYRITLSEKDDLKELANRLNYMADRLRMHEDLQKEFLSNISHDIRSPLTTIKAYTDALADGTITPEQQGRSLAILSSEVSRLDSLMDEILRLSSLDSSSSLLRQEVFDIQELVRVAASAFEGTCRDKHISIRLVFCRETLPVLADRAMSGLALRNLLDNAVYFSREYGEVKVETSLTHGRCSVSVSDEGPGIPRSEITRIWDRFYKGDNSRGMRKNSSGLGLTVVREIMLAHGQTASVVSTEGAGSEFTITFKVPEA